MLSISARRTAASALVGAAICTIASLPNNVSAQGIAQSPSANLGVGPRTIIALDRLHFLCEVLPQAACLNAIETIEAILRR